MNPELEELLRAYDARFQENISRDERLRLAGIYESLAANVAEKKGVSVGAVNQVVKLQYDRWIRSQNRPSTLPPKA